MSSIGPFAYASTLFGSLSGSELVLGQLVAARTSNGCCSPGSRRDRSRCARCSSSVDRRRSARSRCSGFGRRAVRLSAAGENSAGDTLLSTNGARSAIVRPALHAGDVIVGEIPGQHRGGRHELEQAGRRDVDAGALVAAEVEELSLHDRAAERPAELIAVQPVAPSLAVGVDARRTRWWRSANHRGRTRSRCRAARWCPTW